MASVIKISDPLRNNQTGDKHTDNSFIFMYSENKMFTYKNYKSGYELESEHNTK